MNKSYEGITFYRYKINNKYIYVCIRNYIFISISKLVTITVYQCLKIMTK